MFILYPRSYTIYIPVLGNAGDSLNLQNGMLFTTYDADNDKYGTANCARIYRGAWWYEHCHESNLNGLYHHGHHTSHADGINWFHWKGYHYSMKKASMKITGI